MPNWCSNSITIYGDKADIKALANLLKTGKSPFDFELFIPYPEKYAVLDKIAKTAHDELMKKYKSGDEVDFGSLPRDGYNHGGYDWCCVNWGTKWNACDALVDIDRHGESMTIEMDTAWSPPIPVIAKMAEMFPKLSVHLNYEEPGMCFAGNASFCKGKCTEAQEYRTEPEEDEEEWEEEGS